MYKYQLYDMVVCSRTRLQLPETSNEGPRVEFVLACPDDIPPFTPCSETLLYDRRPLGGNDAGTAFVEFHARSSWSCLRYPTIGDFYFQAANVTCFPRAGTPIAALENILLGPVIALLLERRGIPCLHASAVQVGSDAIAFLADSGVGKSSLAARLLAGGARLLCDDITPILLRDQQSLVLPGSPRMKLHARAMHRFVPSMTARAIPIGNKYTVMADPGWSPDGIQPVTLRMIYVLQRGASNATVDGDRIECVEVRPSQRLVELLRFSFCARLIGPLGLNAQRFSTMAQVARQTRISRLTIPDGLERLDEVREFLLGAISAPRSTTAPSPKGVRHFTGS